MSDEAETMKRATAYLKVIAATTSLAEAQREARLALRLIEGKK